MRRRLSGGRGDDIPPEPRERLKGNYYKSTRRLFSWATDRCSLGGSQAHMTIGPKRKSLAGMISRAQRVSDPLAAHGSGRCYWKCSAGDQPGYGRPESCPTGPGGRPPASSVHSGDGLWRGCHRPAYRTSGGYGCVWYPETASHSSGRHTPAPPAAHGT
jgi:hypothetical protein